MLVMVRGNDVDQALRVMKRKLQKEGVFREMKIRARYEKPSEKRKRQKAESLSRFRKAMKKRMEREGY
jgi:small subunit ribosomal protein S21